MNEVDFSSCRRVPGRAYNGANGKKIAVEWQGDCWILEFPPSAAERPNARIVPRIDLAKINAFIGEVPYLTDLQREFYRTYLFARYERLLGLS